MVNVIPPAEQACSFMERRHAFQPVPTPLAVGDTPFGDDRTPRPVQVQILLAGAAGVSLANMSSNSTIQQMEIVNLAMSELQICEPQPQSEEAVQEVTGIPNYQADEGEFNHAYMLLMVQKMLLQPGITPDNTHGMAPTAESYSARVEEGQGMFEGALGHAIAGRSHNEVAAVLSKATEYHPNPLTPAFLTMAIQEVLLGSECEARDRIHSLLHLAAAQSSAGA